MIASAGTYAANGSSSEIAVSRTGSSKRLRTAMATYATASPTTRPPTAATRKPMVTSSTVTALDMAKIATRKHVMAVASLTSDSPSRMVISRRGSPTRRAIEVAATASGGATTAPSANATANGMGRISQATSPTPGAVTTTNRTDR